ncbi:probable cation-transporting ATPase W08D2.5 isoform X2 [Gordionus sp. m RMFG-2023]|uniref:probable cation-transporting ATPase W08D2.5 isoform X2 n=1 Tax=Gordionus sp. m RMFG-2023 TaxID=3053472 RepID=UPI0031FDFD59
MYKSQLSTSKSYIYIIDDGTDDEIEIIPYKRDKIKQFLTYVLITLTIGIAGLLFYWKKHWYIKLICNKTSIEKCEILIIIDCYKLLYVTYIQFLDADELNSETIIHNEGKKLLEIPENAGQFIYKDRIKYFKYHGNKYIWRDDENCYKHINNFEKGLKSSYFSDCTPLSIIEQGRRRIFFGPNDISVKVKPIYKILFYEVLTPFYIFQIFSVILWYNDEYELYASCILIISVLSLFQSTYEIRKDQMALHKLSKMMEIVHVFREDGKCYEIPSYELVPGDIIKIPPKGCFMTCDAVLLSGSCIVNESMLTGESVPVTKTPMHDSTQTKIEPIFDRKKQSKHILFCGTRIIQSRYYGTECTKAFILSTGFNTTKGEIIRSILFPKPCVFNFNQDSYKFIAALFGLSFIGFLYSSILKIMSNVSVRLIILRSIDLVTIVVPPALPAAMTIGIVFAKNRLKKYNIFCVSPTHINVCGVLDLFCFDKTGTLTEDGLDILGILPSLEGDDHHKSCDFSDHKNDNKKFGSILKNGFSLSKSPLLYCMSTCHSLTTIDGELIGDPLDIKMFETTGWRIKEPSVDDSQKYDMLVPAIVHPPLGLNADLDLDKESSREEAIPDQLAQDDYTSSTANCADLPHEIGIIRQFPFLSSLQRMSVVVLRLKSQTYEIYCKGSPEKISTLCLPETLPPNFYTKLASFTQNGLRVIALAWKPLPDLKWAKIQRINRDQVEKELTFLGLLIFENKLKAGTKPTLRVLKKANIRTVMVTGDNLLTAVSVARESNMIEPDARVKVVQIDDDPRLDCAKMLGFENGANIDDDDHGFMRSKPLELRFTDLSDGLALPGVDSYEKGDNTDHAYHCNGLNGRAEGKLSSDYKMAIKNGRNHTNHRDLFNKASASMEKGIKCHLVMTGEIFQTLLDQDPALLDRILAPSQCDFYDCDSTVFARMSPDAKTALVERFQSLNYRVGACGDGANDCGALKTAHAGLALSNSGDSGSNSNSDLKCDSKSGNNNNDDACLVSPFTYTRGDIRGVLPLIGEGRCALATSFAVFEYMASYSLVQFTSVLLLYWIGASFSDQQFAYVDLVIITLHALAFGRTHAYRKKKGKKLRKMDKYDNAQVSGCDNNKGKKKRRRKSFFDIDDIALSRTPPESSLVAFAPIFSLATQILIQISFMVLAYFWVRSRPWFVPYDPESDPHEEFITHTVTVIFYVSAWQYITLAHTASTGPPHRQPLYTNPLFVGASLISGIFTTFFLVLFPFPAVARFFYLQPLPISERWYNANNFKTSNYTGNLDYNVSSLLAPGNNGTTLNKAIPRNVPLFDLFGPRFVVMYIVIANFLVSMIWERFICDKIISPLTKNRDILLRKKIPKFKQLALGSCNHNFDRWFGTTATFSGDCDKNFHFYEKLPENLGLGRMVYENQPSPIVGNLKSQIAGYRHPTPPKTLSINLKNDKVIKNRTSGQPLLPSSELSSNTCSCYPTNPSKSPVSHYPLLSSSDKTTPQSIPYVSYSCAKYYDNQLIYNNHNRASPASTRDNRPFDRIPPLGEIYIPKDITKL